MNRWEWRDSWLTSDLGSSAKLLLHTLLSLPSWRDGWARPGNGWLVKVTGLSERTIRRAISTCVERKLISVTHTKTSRTFKWDCGERVDNCTSTVTTPVTVTAPPVTMAAPPGHSGRRIQGEETRTKSKETSGGGKHSDLLPRLQRFSSFSSYLGSMRKKAESGGTFTDRQLATTLTILAELEGPTYDLDAHRRRLARTKAESAARRRGPPLASVERFSETFTANSTQEARKESLRSWEAPVVADAVQKLTSGGVQ